MSAKTSSQPGRRTPLSLSGAVTKSHSNKGGGNAANSGGNNANGHTTSNSNKQDNKLQLQKTEQQQTVNNSDTKENPNKKQPHADKKQQPSENNKKSNEKNQNGINNNKQATENKQQQQNKEKQEIQTCNDNKTNEKDKKEKFEKFEKSDKLEKQENKTEKDESKVKQDKDVEEEKPESKKENKKTKEVKDAKEEKKEEKKETATISDEKIEQETQQIKCDEKKLKEEIKIADEKLEEKNENVDIVSEQELSQQKSFSTTPKPNSRTNRNSTPVKKTPTKISEKTPPKFSPSNTTIKISPSSKREVTTAIDDNDDIEMEPLTIENSPIKLPKMEEVAHINIAPSATSTPGKILLAKRNLAVPKSDVQLAIQTEVSVERPRPFSQISGRKSIRPISDYTPSKFQSNTQFRECYRRINTELDVTNTSMNVTVGSEAPNNLSFSFFGRGRKRDRTPPQHCQSAIGELQTDMEISPPKKARIDMHGFFSVVSSPLSLLRNRFSKATLQSSTPVKLEQNLNASEDEIEVQNVSGVSVHEEIANTETNNSTNDDNGAILGEEIKTDVVTPLSVNNYAESNEFTDISIKCEKFCGREQTNEQSDIKIRETPLKTVIGEPLAKNKKCIIM